MPAPTKLTDDTRIDGGDSTSLSFVPATTGSVFVTSTPPPRSARSETGQLAAIQLYRPGTSRPVASVNYPKSSQSLTLAYEVTAADLAAAGSWTVVVTNAAIDPHDFHTELTYPGPGEVLTATVDIPFLNIVLAKLFDAAAIRAHLQTSDDGSKRSTVSLAADLASQFGLPAVSSFNVGDFTKYGVGYRIVSLDTDPGYPIASIQASPLLARLTIAVDPASLRIESEGAPLPGVRLGYLRVEIDVGFEGSVQVSCAADVHLTFDDIDLSAEVSSAIVDGINGFLHGDPTYAPKFTHAALRHALGVFFKSFLRIADSPDDLSYAADGDTLKVFYVQQP